MEPLALKRAASVKFLLRKTQQHVLHSVGQKCQYIYKQMVLFHVFDSDCEQLLYLETHIQYAHREYSKICRLMGSQLLVNELRTVFWLSLHMSL